MPNKKQQLMEAYIVWKNRPPPCFDEDSSHLSDDNINVDESDNVDKIVKISNEEGKNNESVIQIEGV